MMNQAVLKFRYLLADSRSNQADWIEALQLGHRCFEEWGLVNDAVKFHQAQLLGLGALAVKLTGSGGGGYMISYWQKPPVDVTFEMIPCFN